MGRRLSSFYNPVLAVHAPARTASVHPQATSPPPAQVTTQDTWDILSGAHAHHDHDSVDAREDEASLRPVLKWRDAPFDIDEDRDDAVYEAFVSPDGSALPSPTAGHLGSSLSLSTSLDGDTPSPLDFSDCLDGPPQSLSDFNLLHPSSHTQPPMTPSSAVFHTVTLPLTLPAPRERLGQRRGTHHPVALGAPSSSSLDTNPATLLPLTRYRHAPAGASTSPNSTSPIQFSLPPAPRWTHRQPPATTTAAAPSSSSSSTQSRAATRPWETDEGSGHWDARRSLLQVEFARLLEQLRTSAHS